MKNTLMYIVLAAIVSVVAFLTIDNRDGSAIGEGATTPQGATYRIDGQSVTFGGDTRYFGNELRTDLNGDGREDTVFFLTRQPGGSGTFYYVAAALQTESGYVGSEAVFVGDRIAPQTINLGIHADPASADVARAIIAVNYADRKPGESFVTKPSVGQTLWLRFDPATKELVKVEPVFEAKPL